MAVSTGTFTSVGSSASASVTGAFNVSISGIDPYKPVSINLERSFDAGATWKKVKTYVNDVEASDNEPESVLYRLRCTYHNGGPIEYRVGN
jgi:hypothetical protein